MRTRIERLRLMLAHKAASAAMEASLKAEAAELFEKQKSADTWRLKLGGTPVGQVITATTNDRAEIVDREAFLVWLAGHHPHQVKTEVITVRTVINEKWLTEELLPSFVPADPEELEPGGETLLMDAEGTVIPGVTWRKGGALHGVSVKPDSGVTRLLKAAAALYAEGSGPEVLGLEAAPAKVALAEAAGWSPPVDGPVDAGLHPARGGVAFGPPVEAPRPVADDEFAVNPFD